VTRGQLPQRAGLPGLNGGGTAAAVPAAHACSKPNAQHWHKAIITVLINHKKAGKCYCFSSDGLWRGNLKWLVHLSIWSTVAQHLHMNWRLMTSSSAQLVG